MEAGGGDGGGESYYGECLRNHAARLGVYTVDGCSEFTADSSRPDLLHCTACSCHRNFHRKLAAATNSGVVSVESREDNQCRRKRTKFTAEQKAKMAAFAEAIGWRLKRREESAISAGGEDDVAGFCKEIGVTRHVFKVWLHNHKKITSSAAAAAAAASNVASSSMTNAGGDRHEEASIDPDISAGVSQTKEL